MTEPLIESGEKVMNPKIYEEIKGFIIDNYTSDEDGTLLAEATMVLCGLGAYLKKELGLQFEVTVE